MSQFITAAINQFSLKAFHDNQSAAFQQISRSPILLSLVLVLILSFTIAQVLFNCVFGQQHRSNFGRFRHACFIIFVSIYTFLFFNPI